MNSIMNSTVSIIIPVYNVAQYLDKCLESVMGQSYRQLEIILVNDGSTDDSLRKCQKWVKLDQRIQLVNKAHGGLSDARNVGLSYAHGEYVLFVDSDDWLRLTMVENMLKTLQRTHADLVTCQFINIHPDGSQTLSFPAIHNRVVDRHQYIKLLLQNQEVTDHIWRKMFKRSLIPKWPFKKDVTVEDIAAMPKLIRNCQHFALISQPLYFYRERANSLSHIKSLKVKLDYYHNRVSALKDYQMMDNHLNLNSALIYHWYLNILFNLLILPDYNQQILKARRDIIQHLRRLSGLKLAKTSDRIFNRLLSFSPFLACCFIKWLYQPHRLKNKIIGLNRKLRYRQQFSVSSKNLLLLGRPNYGNLGDRAIAFGEDRFLKQYFSHFKVINVFTQELSFTRHLKHFVKANDLVALQGGGNIGTLYPGIHYSQERALACFKHRKAIIFPQTFYYANDLSGRQTMTNSRSLYLRMKHLLVFTRDPASYQFVKQQLQPSQVKLVPDMALILHPQLKHYHRQGALLILRNDQERTSSNASHRQIEQIVKEKLGAFHFADTHVGYDDFPDDYAKQRLIELWDQYCHAKLVVTDRLHGMIFAAITETPCIALPSFTPKIKGVYDQWLRENDFIQLVTDLNDLPAAIDQVTSVQHPHFKRTKIDRAFDQMAQEIRQLMKE